MATLAPAVKNTGTKLEGPEMPEGIVPAKVTSLIDIGMQKAFEKGKPDVHQVEIIFTSPAGQQIKKNCTLSSHEKSFLYSLTKAATGNPPVEGFDYESLVGKVVTLVTVRKPQQFGPNAGKLKTYISTVTAGQQAPATNPGW